MIRGLLITIAILTALVRNADALVAPHYLHESINCSSCHTFKNAPGPNNTKAATNYALCQQCHTDGGGYSARFLAIQEEFKNYTVGQSGAFHKWNVYTSNPAFGAGAPSNPEMRARIHNGQIVCSTCHNQHMGTNLAKAGRIHKSNVKKLNGSGSGTISYITSNSPSSSGFTVEIVGTGSATTATYKVSYNNGATWFGWNGSQWVAYSANPRIAGGGTPQLLDNLGNASISFSGAGGSDFPAGSKWKFYIGYPYLRAYPDVGNNTTGRRLCRDCHAQRAQTHWVGGNKWDGTIKSHPVGVALNSNGGGYDRKPLDVDGCKQGTTGANCTDYNVNPTNDLLLFQGITSMQTFGNISSGDVQCMTCHAPHWTDSNSKTKDRR